MANNNSSSNNGRALNSSNRPPSLGDHQLPPSLGDHHRQTPSGDGSRGPPINDSSNSLGTEDRILEDAFQDQARKQNIIFFKSGPLFISSKGLGWTSWKKRWFILTRTSLVFYRNDPNMTALKGNEVNPSLGGIELNNSGSVVVREDKKLLTVLFPDGRDGRAFTLKAETSEDMHEWKTALENALSQAPVTAPTTGQNSIFRNDVVDTVENSFEQWKDRKPVRSTVIGRPILLALEDVDGNPSFLEKALRYIEQYGFKVEGILRQSADVEEVERRVDEYEQGKNEFSPNEDAHVIGDCIKHVLRELPSSPVPASCCTALLEAFRGDRGTRLSRMQSVIYETFPEPNRHLLQRILKMMQVVASHKSENRMTVSAVAACMAPLLLRPLLAGDCELDDDFDMGGDGSIQLLQAAAAANHAQAIVIILLEQYDRIFTDDYLQEDSFSSGIYTESEDADYEDENEEEGDDDDEEDEDEDQEDEEDDFTDNGIEGDNGYHDAENDLNHDSEDDYEHTSIATQDDGSSDMGSDLYDSKAANRDESSVASPQPNEIDKGYVATEDTELVQQDISLKGSLKEDIQLHQHSIKQSGSNTLELKNICQEDISNLNQQNRLPVNLNEPLEKCIFPSSLMEKSDKQNSSSCDTKLMNIQNPPISIVKRPAVWGRTSARKNLSMESIDYVSEDEKAIGKLESTKSDLQNKISKELNENERLQASLEQRKEALHERRLALQEDVEKLQAQLQKERSLRASLEAGLIGMQPGLPISSAVDNKTRANLEEIALIEADITSLKQKVASLHGQLNQQDQQICYACKFCGQLQYSNHSLKEKNDYEGGNTIAGTSHNPSSQNEDVTLTENSRNEKSKMCDASSQKGRQPPPKQQQKSMGRNSQSSNETGNTTLAYEPSLSEANTVTLKGNKVEVVMCEKNNDNLKLQTQELPFLSNKHPSQKKGTDAAMTNSTTCSNPASSSSSNDATTFSVNASSKKSSTKSEEITSISPLTRLTNRLNFLKERRIQLVNELQTVGTNRGIGPHGPPPRTNSR